MLQKPNGISETNLIIHHDLYKTETNTKVLLELNLKVIHLR